MQILQNVPMDFITPCSPFGGAGPFFSQHFRNVFEVFFGVAVKVAFLDNFCRFGHPKGSLLESIFAEFADFT